MKNWKFVKVENKDTPELREKLRDIDEQIKNWEQAKGIDGVEKQNAQKTIDDLRKERSKIQQEITTGNESIDVPEKVMAILRDRYNKALTESEAYEKLKSVGMDEEKAKRLSKNPGNFTRGDFQVKNESIEKQEWSLFKGLAKDAEKEVGNAYTPNPELIKILEALLHNRIPEQEAREKIMKITGDKNITDMMIHSPGGFIPVGNKKVGNAKVDWSKVTDKYIDKNGHEVVIQKKEDGYYITNLRNGKEIFAPDRYSAIGIMEKNGSRVENEETKAERKFGKVMGEFEEGSLKTPQGKTVTDPSQAKAIAYSEADKVDNLKRARNSIKTKNSDVTLWKDNDTVYIKEDGHVQYLENNSFVVDEDKYDSQEKAIEDLTKKGYHKK